MRTTVEARSYSHLEYIITILCAHTPLQAGGCVLDSMRKGCQAPSDLQLPVVGDWLLGCWTVLWGLAL